MPKYLFVNCETRELEEHTLRISEYDSFKENNPHLERYIDAPPSFSYNGVGDFGTRKPDDTWKEVLQKIGEQNPGSALDREVNRRSSKQVKVDQIIEKHAKLQRERRMPPKPIVVD